MADRRVGPRIEGWTPPRAPDAPVMDGRWVRLERLEADRYAPDLFTGNRDQDWVWDYMPYGPFADAVAFHAWARGMAAEPDPFFYALIDKATGRAAGVAAYLRITPAHGTIEIGHICLSPALQGSRTATEAFYLMADWAFAAGYRRYEWKCDALNLPSRRAAQRLGFSYEGTFRQHMVYKGRNRDTAWFAMTDRDWRGGLAAAYGAWLEPGNFDADGRQRQSLSDLTRPFLVTSDPLSAGG